MTASVAYDTMSTTSRLGPMFTKCCFCIPLRMGCFILGYLSLIFNTFQTLALLTMTTYFGITTHGFDHFEFNVPRAFGDQTLAVQSIEKPFLNQIGVLLMFILCANVAWLIINVACLVGLHKKKPGPIRVYVAFATVRLLLSLAAFVYLVMSATTTLQSIVIYSIDIILTAYFLAVYYVYAMQLEREQSGILEEAKAPVADITFIYPTKVDKESLVAKI